MSSAVGSYFARHTHALLSSACHLTRAPVARSGPQRRSLADNAGQVKS